MRKTLRYVLVSLALMLVNVVSATEVTFLPSDISPVTSDDYYLMKDGVMMTVTASTVNDSEFRIFKNQSIAIASMSSAAITKVVFTCTANGTEKYGPGNFAGYGYTFEADGNVGTWEGSAPAVALTAESAQVRCTKIVVTLGDGGENPYGPGDDDEPGGHDGLIEMLKFISGNITDKGDQVVFDFKGESEVGEVTGNMVFNFANDICSDASISMTFPSAELAQQAYQQIISDDDYNETNVTIDGTTISSSAGDEDMVGMSKIVLKSMLKMMISNTYGLGTLESPLLPYEANVFAGTLDKDEVTDENFYVKGKIASIKYTFSAQYGTATFFISEDGQDDFTFQCYSVYYLGNKPWVDGDTQVKVGDEVIICGKLVNYKGNTPETASKQAYIYSLNGVTDGGEEPQPVEAKKATVAEFNAAEESNSVWYILTGVVSNLKDGDLYGNFDLTDETGSVYVYGVLSEQGGAKKLFQELVAAKGIKNGSVITIIGNRGSYNGKIEVTNAYFVSVDNSTGISNAVAAQQPAVIYSLSGQRLTKAQKGLNIINGKKVMVK